MMSQFDKHTGHLIYVKGIKVGKLVRTQLDEVYDVVWVFIQAPGEKFPRKHYHDEMFSCECESKKTLTSPQASNIPTNLEE